LLALLAMKPEYRSVLLLAGLALVGQLARCALLDPGTAPGDIVLLGQGKDSAGIAAHRDSARDADRPLADGELIDLDRATAAEIARLPGIGPDMARRLVEYRAQHGDFGGIEALDAVPGVGPALLAKVARHVRFSGVRASTPAPSSLLQVGSPVALNTASVNELGKLPGIGPGRAAAIVAYREAHGPFASIDALGHVPGIGSATLVKLRPFLDIR
jgi:competence ComEA-like helix-hairpin-helix protein